MHGELFFVNFKNPLSQFNTRHTVIVTQLPASRWGGIRRHVVKRESTAHAPLTVLYPIHKRAQRQAMNELQGACLIEILRCLTIPT